MNTRRRCVVGLLASAALGRAAAQAPELVAPNVVPIDDRLVTSGQPQATALASLSRLGFQAVISLAPADAPDAVADEPALLQAQGIDFVHLPVAFDVPSERDFEALSAALRQHAGRRVLVHCQVNMRASTLVFLHRAIVRREDPAGAWEAVTRVWLPRGPWQALIVSTLRRHGVAFDPY